MKLITAVVLPHALDDVRSALERHAVLGMTVSEISVPARGRRGVEVHKGVTRPIEVVPRLRVETVVHDELVERVLEQIVANLAGAEGQLTVVPVDAVLRVRTGERGADAV